MHIIDKLAPVENERLLRLLLPLYYKKRLTENMRNIIEDDIERIRPRMNIYKTSGFILTEKNLSSISFRKADCLNENNRGIKEIYEEEISSGITQILSVSKSISKDYLYSELNILLDFSILTKEIRETYDKAVNYLVSRNIVKEDKSTLFLI